jgi:bacterial/archaeal transporter family protein
MAKPQHSIVALGAVSCAVRLRNRRFRALKLGDAARVAPIDKLSVVLVAVFGVIFLGEKLTVPNWAGVALIAIGAVLVSLKG